MARTEMLVVMTYDVSDNKRRRRLSKHLETRMTRVQKSVFEARLTRGQTEDIARRAGDHLGPGDSLRVYSVGADGLRRSEVLGDGAALQDAANYWLV